MERYRLLFMITGIPRIIGKVKKAGLREPEFIGGQVDLIKDNSDLNDPDSAGKLPKKEKGKEGRGWIPTK